jgi:hypothetical protein
MKTLLVFGAALLCACTVTAQTRVDLPTQGKGILSDCAMRRKNSTELMSSSCAFSFPNQTKVSLTGISINVTGGSGTAFIYADVDGEIHVGHSATLVISCTTCTDAGSMVSFPTDVARIATWPATDGAWDTSGEIDDRVFISGAPRLTPGPGVLISDSGREQQIAIDTALVQSKLAAQAGQETLCLGSADVVTQTCAMVPALAAYTSGMRIRWKSGATNTGPMTLSAGPGALPVKKANGLSDPAAGEIIAGQYYDLTYDGAVLRLPAGAVLESTGPSCAKYMVQYTDISAAETTTSITLKTLSANEAITGLRIKHSAPFTGGSATSVTVSLGKAGDIMAYSPAFNIFQAVGSTVQLFDAGLLSADAANHPVIATFTGSHNLNTLTAGSVDIHLCTVVLP